MLGKGIFDLMVMTMMMFKPPVSWQSWQAPTWIYATDQCDWKEIKQPCPCKECR